MCNTNGLISRNRGMYNCVCIIVVIGVKLTLFRIYKLIWLFYLLVNKLFFIFIFMYVLPSGLSQQWHAHTTHTHTHFSSDKTRLNLITWTYDNREQNCVYITGSCRLTHTVETPPFIQSRIERSWTILCRRIVGNLRLRSACDDIMW